MTPRRVLPLIVLLSVLTGVAAAQTTDIYVVPFSHLDLYWAGTREECLSRGNRIITKAIRMARQYPQFRFLLEDEVFVANYVETHQGTGDLDALKRLVKEGRIEIAPKWAAILQNLPRGEAHVRNIVYGKRYAQQVFGVDPLVANLGDLPGYTSQFPQILAKSRVPYMVLTRMGPADKSLFYYRAPDGSKSLVWNTLKGYGWGTFITSKTLTAEQKQARLQKDLDDLKASAHGAILMNWGTDLWAPADDLVPAIEGFKAPAGVRIRFASPSEFFRVAEKSPSIPETTGEIPHAWANILSSIVDTWPPAIAATDALTTAEKFAAVSYALGYGAYPQQEFERLWKQVLEAQDHNNFGQGGAEFGGDARKLEYGVAVRVRSEQILRDALRDIAERVKSPFPRAMPVVVFNPMGWARDDAVRAHVSLYGDASPGDIADYRKAVRLVDETGAAVPFHVEKSSGTVSRSLELVFVARGVPSLGYKTYFVAPADAADQFPQAALITSDQEVNAAPKRVLGEDRFENRFYRLAVDRITGAVTVFDKDLGRVVARNIEMAAQEERGGDTLSREVLSGRTIVNAVRAVRVEENNGVRAIVRIDGDLGGTAVTQRLVLYADVKRIDIENTVDWRHGGRLMKIEQVFPYENPAAEIRYGTPFGSAAGTDFMPGAEPRAEDEIGKDFWKQWRQIHDWIWAGTTQGGVTVAADRQVVTLAPGAIRAGMFRSTYSSIIVTRDGKPTTVQMPPEGKYVFRYSFTSGPGDWKTAKSYRTGMDFNNPLIPIAVADELSQKSLPATQSFCSLEAANLVISAVKKSDLDASVVLRLFEIEGTQAVSSVDFLGRKTAVRELNLLEEDLSPAERQAITVTPFEIRTLKLRPR